MAIQQLANTMQHVVAIPYPAQGHINPMLQLCQQLVPRGFTFTFVNTHHIHQRLQHASHMHAARHEDDDDSHHDEDTHAHQDEDIHIHTSHSQQHAHCGSIHMVSVEGGCAPEQHAHISTSSEAFKAAQAMKEPVEKLLTDIMKKHAVVYILLDILLGWSSDTAHKFGLPWVAFWPASAATYSIFTYFYDLAEKGEVFSTAVKGAAGEVPLLQDIPGLPPTHLDYIPKVWDDAGNLYQEVLKYFKAAEHASFLLFNTFAELEGQVLAALSKRNFPVLAVGPLVPSTYMKVPGTSCLDSDAQGEELHLSARPSLFPEDRTCLEWLDQQAPCSVLFISFGSISLRSEEQLEELAEGVEASGCPYLWVRRPDISADNGRVNGFTHGQKYPGRLIVPWAPQLQVLSHPSVGGFITHCGWNSVMESVSMGVPMLCWADTGERMSNQRFVVEFWKCGLDMVSDSRRATQHIDEAVLVRRDEVEKSVRLLMVEEAGASIRARATQLRDAAILAFQNSRTHLNEFVQTMEQRFLPTLN